MAKTIAFSERTKGWPSEFSYEPGLMCRLNNRFFTIKNGQLFKHNIENAPRNNFYGQQSKSKIVKVFNEVPEDDKIFKTLVTESDGPWKVVVKTNLTNSSIKSTEFELKGSKWHGYIRCNENESDLSGVSQGIGRIQDIQGSAIEFNNISETVSVGDKLFQIKEGIPQDIGSIDNISDGIISVSGGLEVPEGGLFCFGKKDSRTNGAEITGYYMEVTLEDDTTGPNELFAIQSNVVKAYL